VNELIHQADLAVYRAKLQGRNRVLHASTEPLLIPAERTARLAAVPADPEFAAPAARAVAVTPDAERRRTDSRRHMPVGPRFLSLSRSLIALVALVATAGIAIGVGALLTGGTHDMVGSSPSSLRSGSARRSRLS